MLRHPKEFVLQQLADCTPLRYNRFQWWRNWKVRDELHHLRATEDKIRNGDFNPSPYYWMAQYALIELEEKTAGIRDLEKKREVESLYMEKYRRLLEDYNKDEKKRLEGLIKEFTRCFKLTKADVEQIMSDFEGTLEELYKHLTTLYAPHRTAPPKF